MSGIFLDYEIVKLTKSVQEFNPKILIGSVLKWILFGSKLECFLLSDISRP